MSALFLFRYHELLNTHKRTGYTKMAKVRFTKDFGAYVKGNVLDLPADVAETFVRYDVASKDVGQSDTTISTVEPYKKNVLNKAVKK